MQKSKYYYCFVPKDETYPMNLPRLGHAVIINNVAKEMPDVERDINTLKDAYETVVFNVQVHEDLSVQV